MNTHNSEGTGLLGSQSRHVLVTLTAVGAAALFAAVRIDAARAWANLLLANFYFLALALCAAAFIAVNFLAKAAWPTIFRRIPEAFSGYLPVGAALTALSYFGVHDLYHWAHPGEHDAVLAAKHAFLNVPMFYIRSAVYFAVWIGFTRAILGQSRGQDKDGRPQRTGTIVALSAAFLVLFGITFSLASIDWIMTLEAHWYSTIFPWYVFSGSFVHAISAVTLLLILLNAKGYFPNLNKHHLHDLGKYLFAFSVFWGYLWFSQYLLIWYSNIPEEAAYYLAREGTWKLLFWLNPVINLIVPFVLLLTVRAKESRKRMLTACAVLFLGRWIDLYVMIMPSIMKEGPQFGWMEIFLFLGAGSIFFLLFDRTFNLHAAEPEKDPYWAESAHHHAS